MTSTSRIGLLLAAVALVGTAGTAEAANLDKVLLEKAPDVLRALKDADVKNVGVLPFKVRRGTRQASFDAAPLAAGLPGRLENALILRQGNTERLAIGIIRDAATVGGKAGVGSWSKSRAGFARLFTTSYPLAWGNAKVRPDAFLTGEVRSGGDRATTEVVLQLLTSKSWASGKAAPKDLLTLKVKTDRSLLRDLGYNFVVSRALVRKGAKARSSDLDQDAIESVDQEEKGEKQSPPPSRTQTQSHTPDNIAGMKFEIEYDGVKQEITALAGQEGSKQPTFQVAPPRPGQKVVMYLTRVLEGDQKLGVVLRVNGKSVFEEQEQEALACKRWIYAPKDVGRRDDFAGFYRKDEDGRLKVKKLLSLGEEEARAKIAEMGPRAGWIDIEVVGSRDGTPPQDGEVLISTRSLTRAKAKTLRELRTQLAKANNVRLSTVAPRNIGGLLVSDVDEEDAGTVATDSLASPALLGGISIRYLERGGKTVDE